MSSLAILRLDATGFSWPLVLLVGAAIVAVIATYLLGGRDQERSPVLRMGLLTLRIGAILCLLVALGHPVWVSLHRHEEKPILAVVLDNSRSMSAPAGASGSRSRYAAALDLLQGPVAGDLATNHEVLYFDVTGKALEAGHLPRQPEVEGSPLTAALLRVQRDLRGQRADGILLLSDGNEIDPLAEADAAHDDAALAQLRLPVFTVPLGSDEGASAGAPDLAIQAVATNSRALVGNTVRVRVDIAASGLAAGSTPTFPLAILLGDKPVAARQVTWHAGDTLAREDIEFTPTQAGRFTYTVQVGPLPGGQETDLDNNRQTFPLLVRAKALTVLYIDGVLRWEGKFIREALSEDPDLNVISVVRTTVPGADSGSPGVLLPEQLGRVDVVILGDIEASYFSAAEIAALRNWVTHQGGGLVLAGGYRSFGPQGFGRTDLRDILPIEFSAAVNPQIERPFNLKLTPAGQESPIFHLTGDRDRDMAFYQALPALNGCARIAAVKPGAEVLAVDPQVAGPQGSTAAGMPVMISQQVGSGRTVVFTVDTTWRWRQIVGGFTGDTSFYQRFWSQLVRWVARGQHEDTVPQLTLGTDRYRYRSGDTIRFTAEIAGTPGTPGKGQEASRSDPTRRESESPSESSPASTLPLAPSYRLAAVAVHESGKRLPVTLAEVAPGRWQASLGAADPGRWDICVSAEPRDASESAVAQTAVLTVEVDRPDIEMMHTRPDLQYLSRVAQATGGRVLPPAAVAAWARDLPGQPVTTARMEVHPLWRNPGLITLFLGLLCTEWLLRRRARLA